jgi:hypothetical protein
MSDPVFHEYLPSGTNARSDPLGWLSAECVRLRDYAFDLLAVSRAATWLETDLETVATFLTYLPHLFRFESERLFPLLKIRARRDDDFRSVMTKLSAHHKDAVLLTRRALPSLEALRRAGTDLPADLGVAPVLTDLASMTRQHFAMLNAVILPIARLRFSVDDLAALAEVIDFEPDPAALKLNKIE